MSAQPQATGAGRRGASPKRRGSPGPGAYNPKPTTQMQQGHLKGQQSSFKSTSTREMIPGGGKVDASGDPGRYNPSLSYTDPRKKSFGWEATPSASQLEKLKAKAKTKGGKLGVFGGGTQRRELQMQTIGAGESGPGPGAYMPASTFGKFEGSREKQQQRSRPTSSFKSLLPARPRPSNEHVPGPGAHSPSTKAIDKNLTNSAPHLSSKMPLSGGSMQLVSKATPYHVGPGAYNSHVHNSVAKNIAKKVEMMSRQNPGFGIALPAHELPHEQAVEDDQELPGPGKYEPPIKLPSKSNIHFTNGHSSVFKPPTKRTKGPPDDPLFGNNKGGNKGNAKGGKKGSRGGVDSTVHV